MGQPAARITDLHVCPMVAPGPVPHVGGPIVMGEPTVLIGSLPASRIGDSAVCAAAPDSIAAGAANVLIGGKPAARLGDMCTHGGAIVSGLPTVLIGIDGAVTPPVAPPACMAQAAAARSPFVRA